MVEMVKYPIGQQDFKILRSRRGLYYDHSAEDAICQIEENRYSRHYQTNHRQIFKIGVSFSSKTRCIEEWKIVVGDEK